MAASFRHLTLSATRTLRSPLASSRPSSSKLQLLSRRAASSQATTLENVEVADEPPQIVPTAEDMEKDPQLAGLGYPILPQESRQKRPALGNWWDRQERCAPDLLTIMYCLRLS